MIFIILLKTCWTTKFSE